MIKPKDIKTDEILHKIPLFAGMDAVHLTEIKRFLVKKKFKKNEVIFWEQDTNQFMYIILSGKVKVSKNTEDEKERILAIHKSGEFFGEMSLLDGQTEPATVIAKEDCTLMIISKTDFDKLLTNPDFAKQLLMILCQRLRSSWSQMGWLAMVNAAEKTKSALRYLTFHHGFQEGEFIRLKIKLTHAEFGEVAGMSRETVSREFQKLKDEDNLKIEEGHLFIKKSWLEYYPPTMASVSKEEFD